MILKNISFIDYQHISLYTTIGGAMAIMDEENCNILPVFDKTKYVGLVYGKDIIECNDYDLMISEVDHFIKRDYLFPSSHIIEAVSKIKKHSLLAITLLSEEKDYIGILSCNSILLSYISFMNNYESSIILEIKANRNYLASELFKVFENSHSKINSFSETGIINNEFVTIQVFCFSENIKQLKENLFSNGYIVQNEYLKPIEYEINPMNDNYNYLMKILDI